MSPAPMSIPAITSRPPWVIDSSTEVLIERELSDFFQELGSGASAKSRMTRKRKCGVDAPRLNAAAPDAEGRVDGGCLGYHGI